MRFVKVVPFFILFFVFGSCLSQKKGYYTSLKEALKKPNKVVVLDLNDEHNIGKAIYKFKNLEKLYVSDSKLDSVSDAITNMKSLKILSCRSCGVVYVSKLIQNLESLEKIIITGGHLDTIPFQINALKNLKYLDLSNNRISFFTKRKDSYNSRLTFLNLSGNNLEKIPSFVYQCKSTERLLLMNNKIDSISPKISKLLNLRELHVYKNRIKKIPEELLTIQTLKTLNVGRNELTKIKKAILISKSIETLDLSYNSIQNIPDIEETNIEIKNISLRKNPINDEQLEKIKNKMLPTSTLLF